MPQPASRIRHRGCGGSAWALDFLIEGPVTAQGVGIYGGGRRLKMEFLAVVEQGALAYPALLPLFLVALALTLWACEHKRWLWATAAGILGCAACMVYIGSPANASARPGNAPLQAGVAQVEPDKALTRGSRGATRALLDPGHFSSSVK